MPAQRVENYGTNSANLGEMHPAADMCRLFSAVIRRFSDLNVKV